MSIDCRTRRRRDLRDVPRDEIFDTILPEAARRHGRLAARGLDYKGLPSLALVVGDRRLTLRGDGGELTLAAGDGRAGVVAELDEGSLSDWVQDQRSCMGLAMNAKVKIARGDFDAW